MAEPRPEDECPHRRPFPADFDGCSAFQPGQYTGLDLMYRPLPSVWTCNHLEVQRHPGSRPGFYGRCALGDAEARARWVAEVKTSRIKAVRRLSRELATALGPLGRRFWEAKGSQLKALSEGDDPTAPTRALDSAAAELQAAVEAFLEEHTQALNEIGMPLAATSQLVRSAVDTMLAQRSTESSFQITDDMLERFPPELRAFLRPRSAA